MSFVATTFRILPTLRLPIYNITITAATTPLRKLIVAVTVGVALASSATVH